MTGNGQDLAYGIRRLRRSPGFTLGEIAVLALGVGVNLAEFHIFNAILFRRISVRDVDSLRRFSRHGKTMDSDRLPFVAIAFYCHCHYTATHASWMNMIECFFSILTRQAPTHSVHRSKKDLKDFLIRYNTLSEEIQRESHSVHLDQRTGTLPAHHRNHQAVPGYLSQATKTTKSLGQY